MALGGGNEGFKGMNTIVFYYYPIDHRPNTPPENQ